MNDENKRSDGKVDISKGSEATEQNLIKATCKELNLTYKQLGELIGLSEGSIKRLATSDEINTQAVKSCEMLLEIKILKKELDKLESLKIILKELVK